MIKVIVMTASCLALITLLGSCNSSSSETPKAQADAVTVDATQGNQVVLNEQKTAVSTAVFPNSDEGARKIAEALNKDDAYSHKLYKSLFPDEPDFSYIVTSEEDRITLNEYTYPTYRSGLYMQGAEGEKEVVLHKLTTKDIKDGNLGTFDQGYETFAPILKDDITFYAFEFVKDGAKTGSRFETLVCINNKWIFTPTPYKSFN